MGEANMKETILKGFIYTPFDGSQPQIVKNLPIGEAEETIQYKSYRIKVVGAPSNIDSGAFEIYGTQCQVIFNNSNTPDGHLELVMDIVTHKSHPDTWWYHKSKPLKIEGQIYLWNFAKEIWIDATTTSTKIAKVYDKKKTAQQKKWSHYYGQLRQLGYSGKEAKYIMSLLKWKTLDEFIGWSKFLKKNNFPQNILKVLERN